MATSNTQAVGVDLATVLPTTKRPWYRIPHLLRLNVLLLSSMLFSATMGYDNSMMNGLQTLPQWQSFMSNPTGTYLGAINATQAAGSCLGYAMMSTIANRFGRKMSVYVGCGFLVVGTVLQTASHSVGLFITSRFLVGISSGLFGAVPALIAECAYPTHRGRLTAGYNCLYYVGSLLSAWTVFGTRDYSGSWAWRVPSLVQLATPSVAIWALLLAPESPRWLVSRGRVEEARKMFVKWHAGGDEDSPLVKFEMMEVEQAIKYEATQKGQVTYADMLKTSGNRRRTLISVSLGIFAQWNGVGVVSYYLAIVLDTVGVTSVTSQTLINGLLQLWNLIIACSAAAMVDKLGRRFLFLTSSIGMLICYIIITGLSGSFATSGNSSVGLAVVPMLFIYYGFYDIAYTPLLIAYPTEIWPYALRSKGMAVSCIASFGALFFNLFVNPIGLQNLQWKYYIIYIVILIIIVIVTYVWYVETRGHSLEEIAVIFDGDKAAVKQLDIPRQVERTESEEAMTKSTEIIKNEAKV